MAPTRKWKPAAGFRDFRLWRAFSYGAAGEVEACSRVLRISPLRAPSDAAPKKERESATGFREYCLSCAPRCGADEEVGTRHRALRTPPPSRRPEGVGEEVQDVRSGRPDLHRHAEWRGLLPQAAHLFAARRRVRRGDRWHWQVDQQGPLAAAAACEQAREAVRCHHLSVVLSPHRMSTLHFFARFSLSTVADTHTQVRWMTTWRVTVRLP